MMSRTCIDRIVLGVVVGVFGFPGGIWGQERPGAGEAVPLDRYEVGTALPPQDPGRELVTLTLDQAIERALERNLDVQTARLAPRMQQFSLQAARAAFTPTLNGNYGYNSSTNQSTSQLDGGARTTTERHTVNTSITQTVPWYGGRLGLGFNNSRTSTNNAFSTLNPSYRSTVSLDYTQPLLSGLRTDNQRAALQTEEIRGRITEIQLDARVQNITEDVRRAYWGLRAAIEQIEIQRRNLAQAEQLLADNQVRVRLGTMAQIQVVQAEAQVAAAQQSLLNAEIQWRNQELVLKSLLISGADDPLLYQTVDPVELPTIQDQAVDIQSAIQVALSERTDIRQLRQERRVAEIDLDVTRDSRLPDLDLTASYSLLGVGGTQYDRSGLGGSAVLVEEGGYLDGLNSIAGLDAPTWNVGVSFSYPIGMRTAKANLERARLQMEQRDLAIRSQELAIVTEVTNAGLAVTDTRLQLDAATRSRELAEESAAAEVTRFNAGVATNFEVVAAQDALTSARLSELRAIIEHVNAIAEFERVQSVGR
ncbi:MAG TPA: TolC family protein [Longimicrobiales bacterium]|nr:TolC family protein [Longimicrobiales bacterium]